jgi:hypothetical protein
MKKLFAAVAITGALAAPVVMPVAANAATWHPAKQLHYMQPGHVKDTQWCKLSDTQWG